MIAARAQIKRTVRLSLLTNVRLHVDATGLATGTNNSYGEVDGSNNIVSWKGLSTGSILDTFNVNGTGVTFDATTKSIAFNGSGRLRSAGAATLYDFASYKASLSDLKFTAFLVCKIGTTHKPSSVNYGLYGNNGGSSANKGIVAYYSNNNGTTEDQLNSFVTRGTALQFVGRLANAGTLPSNQWCVIALKFDGAEADGLRMRQYLNDQAIVDVPNLNNNNIPVTTPTYALELGSAGNAAFPFIGNIKEFILTESAETYTNTIAIIRQLMNKHGIVRSRTDYLDISTVPAIFEQSSGSVGLTYHLSGIISQNPTDPTEVFSAYSEGGSHVYAANKKLVGRKSTIKAAPFDLSFGAQGDIYDPAGADAIQDCGGGYDQNGVMHLFVDVLNSGSAGGCVGARHIYSSDLTTWTNTDITSSLHADGLNAWRMYGNMIHVSGVWIKPYYKLTDEGDITNSANYILRSTDGINWTSVTVRAASGTYINEATVVWLGGNNIAYIARNEVTLEWSISLSTDLGLTWDAFSDLTLGETVTSANPPMAKHFFLNGSHVCAIYITNRDNDTAFVVYGLGSNITANKVTGWNLNTKLMWWKTSLAPFHYHYGDVVHLDDTLKAVGLYTYDEWPLSGAGTVSVMNYTTMPTWHIANIESQLGI